MMNLKEGIDSLQTHPEHCRLTDEAVERSLLNCQSLPEIEMAMIDHDFQRFV